MKQFNILFPFISYIPNLHSLFITDEPKFSDRCWQRITAQLRLKTIAMAAIFLSLSYLPAAAQCDTFYNADAANQVLYTYPFNLMGTGLAFTDIDNDGDPDCYIVNNGISFIHFENKGSAKHPFLDYSDLRAPDLGYYTIQNNWWIEDMDFTDLDGDGDKDFFLSQSYYFHHGQTSSTDTAFRYYQNTGTPAAPSFTENDTANPLPAAILDSIGAGRFTFYDIDKDGDLDFTYRSIGGILIIYMNTGCKTAPYFTYYTSFAVSANSKPQYFDWNRDGLPDLFIGGQLYLNVGTLSIPSFTAASSTPFSGNGTPYIVTDVNSDLSPEAYTFSGNMSTLAPQPVIDTVVQKIGNSSFIKYYSHQQLPGYTYSWLYNGKPVAGYHKPFIAAEKRGFYTLEITNNCGTGVSLPHFTYSRFGFFAITAKEKKATLSIEPPAVSIAAYPNPFRSELTVTLPPAKESVKTMVTLTDMAGRRLLSQTAFNGSFRIGAALQKGMYLLQVWQGGKVVHHQLVEKQ